jgi:hypothetical protein
MPAGVRDEVLVNAVLALRLHHGAVRSAALFHGGQRIQMAG